jgi:thiol:disulfide interchange protein DsbC
MEVKMRFLLALLATSLLFSCSNAQEKEKIENKKVSVQEEELIIKAVLKPLSVRGVEVREVKAIKDSPVEGLRMFEVTIIDKKNNRMVRKYIWMSEDGKYLVLDLFKVRKEGKEVGIIPLKPKESEVPLKQDLSWLKAIDEKLQKANIPHIIGNGKTKVYIVWDVYCPFCYRHFKEVAGKKVQELDLQIHMIPLPVHGERSLKGFVYFTQLARKEGMKSAMEKMFSKGNGDFMKYVRIFSKEVDKNYSKIPEKERKELDKFYKDLQKELLSHNIHATPTIIYIPPTEKEKGYVFVGFKPLEEIIKRK